MKYLFNSKSDLERPGVPKKNENGTPMLPACCLESDNDKMTLQGLNKVRHDATVP